jgi:hypothetical protein
MLTHVEDAAVENLAATAAATAAQELGWLS